MLAIHNSTPEFLSHKIFVYFRLFERNRAFIAWLLKSCFAHAHIELISSRTPVRALENMPDKLPFPQTRS